MFGILVFFFLILANCLILLYAKMTGQSVSFDSFRGALVDVSSNTNCESSTSGVRLGYAAKISDVTSITWDSNGIATAIVMATTGKWAKLEVAKNDTAKWSFVGTRVGTNGRKYVSTTIGQFTSVSNAKRLGLEELDASCELLCIWFLHNGATVLQGVDKSTDTGNFSVTKIPAQHITSGDSDVGDNENRYDVKIESTSVVESPRFTTLTTAAIELL